MSYKNKKNKKGIINQLKRRYGVIKFVLFRKIINLIKIKKEEEMQLIQVRKVMQWLRE